MESTNKICFNKKDIINDIKEKGEYEKGASEIKIWEDDMNIDTEMYIIKNKEPLIPFLGVVNYSFKREGYCVNNYKNGDQYFGYYSNDKRNKQGFYTYIPKKLNNFLYMREYYFGLWKDDKKDSRGVYVWLKQNKKQINLINPFINFNDANFQAFVGEFNNDNFSKGTLLSKEGENYFVYHGTYINNLQRHGNKCFYYSATLEQLLFGTFKNNVFVDGYVGKFNDDGELKNFIRYHNKAITNEENSLQKNNHSNNNSKNISSKLLTFRNVIMSKDYFGILFDVFKNIINFKEENMNDIDIMNSDKYLDLMDTAASYNKITIFKDIEKYTHE